MEILVMFFWFGFYIFIASAIFGIAIAILMTMLSLVIGAVTWVWEKIIDKKQ